MLTVRKAVGFAHLWLGLVSGLIIFVVATTGATYVFYNEINDVVGHRYRFVTPGAKPRLALAEIQQIGRRETDRLAGRKKPARWDWISIVDHNDPERAVAYSSREYEKLNVLYEVYIDPYSGKVLRAGEEPAFWNIVVGLHTQLLLGDVGKYLVDYGTLVFLLMLVSGIVLWWPRNKAARKQRFKVKWDASPKRLTYDLHNVLGFYMCWVVIFSALTGTVWAFGWARYALYYLADGKQPTETVAPVRHFSLVRDNTAVLNRIEQQLNARYCQAYMRDYSVVQTDSEVYNVRVWTRKGASGMEDALTFNPATGELLSQARFADKSAGDKLNNMTGDLHYGWILGLPTKVLMFCGCLIAASLPFTGAYIWWGRNRKSKAPRSPGHQKIGEATKASKSIG